jgi:hypothetical protein
MQLAVENANHDHKMAIQPLEIFGAYFNCTSVTPKIISTYPPYIHPKFSPKATHDINWL